MKKLILILLPLILLSCSDSPTEPGDGPPPKGGNLEGVYYDQFGTRLSNEGLYDPHYDNHFQTDLRVNGNRVWFEAKGKGRFREFDGTMQGDEIRGIGRTHWWNPSEGIVGTPGEAQEIVFRR